jgi:arylsulfatase A
VGEITRALEEVGVAGHTMVLFTSDNGPWISYGNHAGKTPFREAKGTGFDGGTRSACILRYPGQIAAGSSSKAMWCTVDVLPTIARLGGLSLPSNPIDGQDVWDLLRGKPGARNPHEFYPFSTGKVFEGVFSGDGRWKLHLPHPYRTLVEAGNDGKAGKYRQTEIGLSLFDMERDPNETANVIARYPEVAARLQQYAEHHRQEFYRE